MPLRTILLVLLLFTCAVAGAAHSFADGISPAFSPFWQQQRDAQDEIGQDEVGRDLYMPRRPAEPYPYQTPGQPVTAPRFEAQRFAAPPPEQPAKKSALEKFYSERIVDELEQFGYDMFGVPKYETRQRLDSLSENNPSPRNGKPEETIVQTPMGAVQDDFVLSSGDQLEVIFTGQRTERNYYTIDNRGTLIIPDFPPIPAAGRSIGQLRVSLETAARNLHNTQAYVSLSNVRQIGVLVVGHVKRPGRQNLTVFHTVLDALMLAGGVEKTGSLRQIKLVRNGRSTIIDLYALLMHGATNMDLQLRDGDRIMVPSIGPTVAVAGEAKRPGIYEITTTMPEMRYDPRAASEKLSLNDMLDFSGGVLAPGQNRFIKLDLTDDGRETVDETHDPFAPEFGDGSILMISKGKEKRAGTVELTGHTRKAGIHALDEAKTLRQLIDSDQVLGPDAYPLVGVIERWDGDQLTGRLIGYPLRLVLKGKFDMPLKDGDVVHIFSQEQMVALSEEVLTENNGGDVRKKRKERREKAEQRRRLAGEGSTDEEETPEPDYIENEAINDFLKERSAFIRGAVRHPGAYPVAEGTTLDSLLAVAGGLALEANTHNIEVTSVLSSGGTANTGQPRREQIDMASLNLADVAIQAGDAVRVNQKFKKVEDNSVLIIGEVKNPGRYDLLPGDKLSDLLERAGNMTDQAYPAGAIFSRESERRAEEARFKSQARELERAIALALNQDEKKVDNAKLMEARTLAKELRHAEGVGRITVEANPAVLKTQPELDLLLEPGDRIYIPRRSLTVRVSGEVLSPASLQFRKTKNAMDYINEAGGFSFNADKDRTFVLYPDGSAQPLQVSSWNYNPAFIPPGSTIIIPNDPKPFDFIESAKDISQILSNLAITSIFIDDIRDN